MLIDNGIAQSEAGIAARLAAGHLGGDQGSCLALISVSRKIGTEQLEVQRIVLTSDASQAIIERRDGQLELTSEGAVVAARDRRA